MLTLSGVEFFKWAKNDNNVLNIRNALTTHPTLLHAKDKVGVIEIYLSFLIYYARILPVLRMDGHHYTLLLSTIAKNV